MKPFEKDILKDKKWLQICHKWRKYVRKIIKRGIRWTQEAFTNKITPDIDGCTDEPVFQCDVRIVKNCFVDDWNDTNVK